MYVAILWDDRYAHLENKPFTDRSGNRWWLLDSPQFIRAGGTAWVPATPAQEGRIIHGVALMIPQVVADVRDILTKTFNVDPDTALKMAWALYEAHHLNDR